MITLLGPQRFTPTLVEAIAEAGILGTVAVATCGWQEREGEVEVVRDALELDVVDLTLHARGDAVFREDRELFEAHRERQNRLRRLQEAYRTRLRHVVNAWREVKDLRGPDDLIHTATDDALDSVRYLESRHVANIRSEHRRFLDACDPMERDVVKAQRDEIAELLEGKQALLIAGGHVAVILNRLRLFGVLNLWDGPIFAWSAGAMALTERVVVFHDFRPQGTTYSEVLDVGFARVPNVVVLPHARERLDLDDPVRTGFLAARYAPAKCLPFDRGCRAVYAKGKLTTDVKAL